MIRNKSWIDTANEHVNIADLLTSFGIMVPSDAVSGGSKKVFCPFGFYHSDGGNSRAMRIYYQSNTAYCFSCSKRYDPVRLAAAKWDCPWNAAALRLLEDAGFKPKTLKERWAEATTQEENKPDLIALADALKMYCSTICSDWSTAQYSDKVAAKLDKCLSLLDSVATDDDAYKWLSTCKVVMKKVLEA
jgi:hypothetical protein